VPHGFQDLSVWMDLVVMERFFLGEVAPTYMPVKRLYRKRRGSATKVHVRESSASVQTRIGVNVKNQ
jgi:hypothetical protein